MQTRFHHGGTDLSASSCPRCGSRLPCADINEAADAALCRECGTAYSYSELVQSGLSGFDVSHPPHGASFQALPGGFVASATTRSALGWLLVPFLLVWSGVSLGGIYGSQFRPGRPDLGFILFGIPFALGTVLLGAYAAMCVCGRVAVARNADEGTVFEGIGPFGWVRRFRWSDIDCVLDEEAPRFSRRNPPARFIAMHFKRGARSSLKFGMLLSRERRWFLISALRSQMPNAR